MHPDRPAPCRVSESPLLRPDNHSSILQGWGTHSHTELDCCLGEYSWGPAETCPLKPRPVSIQNTTTHASCPSPRHYPSPLSLSIPTTQNHCWWPAYCMPSFSFVPVHVPCPVLGRPSLLPSSYSPEDPPRGPPSLGLAPSPLAVRPLVSLPQCMAHADHLPSTLWPLPRWRPCVSAPGTRLGAGSIPC